MSIKAGKVAHRVFRPVSLALILLALSDLALSNVPLLAAEETASWKVHEQKANKLVDEKKYDESLDEYVAAYLDLRKANLDLSMQAFETYQKYRQALKLADMETESTAILEALAVLRPRLNVFVIQTNNEGVRALQASNFALAIEKLEKAIQLDPTYGLAKENLAIAFNNYGLVMGTKKPIEALKYFRKSLAIDSNNTVSRQNTNGILRIIGKNGDNVSDRVTMGDACLKQGDNLGAFVEYSEALRLKDDEETRKKLDSVPITDPILIALKSKDLLETVKASVTLPKTPSKLSEGGPDFGPYMANLQKIIKHAWHPPKGNETKVAVAVFNVDSDGVVSKARIDKTSGVAAADQAALLAISHVGKLPKLPAGSPPNVDIQFTFEYNVYGKDGVNKPAAPVQQKGDQYDKNVRFTVEDSVKKFRTYFRKKEDEAKVQTLLKQATEDKEKAIELIAEVNAIAPGAAANTAFDNAVKALGKNPASNEDLYELAEKERSAKDYEAAVFVFNRAQDPASTSDRFKHERRSSYALYIADELKKEKKVDRYSSPYNLFARSEDLSALLQQSVSFKDPASINSVPNLPSGIDLAAFVEAAPELVSQTANDSTSLGGVDDVPAPGMDINQELGKLSTLLDKDSDNDALRIKQSVLLVQYGNMLSKDSKLSDAATKYREALYIYPPNGAAAQKLSECLKKQGIDPNKALARMSCFNKVYESGQLEASIAELREGAKVADDGPTYALLGLCMLEDHSKSTAGYRNLVTSLHKDWPDGTDVLKARVHVVIGKLLERDAERARSTNNKNRRLSDLQRMSVHYRLAALLDPKNQDATNGFLEVAKEGMRLNNNATNNLVLGGAYMLKGNQVQAGECYANAMVQAPRDPAVRQAYDKYKQMTAH